MAIRKYPLVVVDICNRAIQQIILHEGESAGSVLPFQIVNNGVPLNLSGYDVNFYLIKPDGKKVLNSCDIKSPADGLVDYTITDQTVSMSGRGLINIQLIEGAKIAYSGGIRTEIEYTGMGSDSNEEVNLFSQIVEATKTSAEKAKEYAMSALEAYTQTEQALRETKNCQTKACNCAQAAQEALALATQAKKDAAAYATNAQTSADLAETSANTAEQSTADAAASAEAAKTSETNAKSSETAAEDSAAEASQSKVAAKASADSAKAEAGKAAGSATTAGAQATTATNKAAEAAASATAAKGSQDAAALSAQAADAKATAAIGSANTAERASNSAGVAATAAFNNANDAKASADKAKASETNAAGSASTAQTIADNLQGTVTAAENATSRANAAAERAEQASQTVQPDATKTRKGIVQIGDGIDVNGGVISVPVPDLSSKADKVHKHSTADITGLDAALAEAGKVKSVNGQTGDVTILAVPTGGTAGQVLKKTPTGFDWGDDDDTQPDLTPYAKKADVTADLNKKVDKVSGKGLSTEDYTTDEKDKLAGIAEGANKYTLPTASAQKLGGIKVGTNLSVSEDGTLSATDTTYSPATPTSPGLMSAADKVAVDGIGSASEAPDITDKSSVWAAINEAASKGGDSALMALLKSDLQTTCTKMETVYGGAGTFTLPPDAEERNTIISSYLGRYDTLSDGMVTAMTNLEQAMRRYGLQTTGHKLEDFANLLETIKMLSIVSIGEMVPGNKAPIVGDYSYGYFGSISAEELGTFDDGAQAGKLVTGTSLAAQVGITAGELLNDSIIWHKFVRSGEIILVAQKPIRKSISWNNIAAANCVFGGNVQSIGGIKYKITLLTGLNTEYDNPGNKTGSEWNDFIIPLNNGTLGNVPAVDTGESVGKQALYTLCQNTTSQKCSVGTYQPTDYIGLYRCIRTNYIRSSDGYSYDNSNGTYADTAGCGWRPALRFTL